MDQNKLNELALQPDIYSIVVGEIGNEQGRIVGVSFSHTAALTILNNEMFQDGWGKIEMNGQTVERRERPKRIR